jgi:ferredoxin
MTQRIMSHIKGEISRRELLKLASPLGRVTLEKAKCTGCGLCALDCPSGALAVEADNESGVYQLLFKHNLCVACGQCVEICPERCLHLERTVELDEISRPAAVLFEDEMVRCTDCGRPLATRAMINSVRAKLPTTGQLPSSYLELCPECKVKVQLGQTGS